MLYIIRFRHFRFVLCTRKRTTLGQKEIVSAPSRRFTSTKELNRIAYGAIFIVPIRPTYVWNTRLHYSYNRLNLIFCAEKPAGRPPVPSTRRFNTRINLAKFLRRLHRTRNKDIRTAKLENFVIFPSIPKTEASGV